MTASEQRAARRRATWTGGVASSVEELEEIDLEQWLACPPVERIRTIWSLVEDSLALGGNHGPLPRLQRSIGGVRPLRG